MDKKRINQAINNVKEWTNAVYNSTTDNSGTQPYTITTSGTIGDDYVWVQPSTLGGSWTSDQITVSYPDINRDIFDEIKNSFGVLYIEADCIKVKTKSGKDITLAKIDEDNQIKIMEKILAVFARESLVE